MIFPQSVRRLTCAALAGLFAVAFLPISETEASPAQELHVAFECSKAEPGAVRATFSWRSASSGPQWLDLSVYDNGFARGTFLGAGPLKAERQSFVWNGLRPDVVHFARVNTQVAGSWQPSRTLSFRTLGCGKGTDPGLDDLRSTLRAEIADAGLNAAVAVTDLQTGDSIDVRGDEQLLAGCTINLLVLTRAVMDLDQGLYPESRIGDLISRTTYSSNPVTARDLLLISGDGDQQTGTTKVRDLMRALEMSRSVYDHPPAYLHQSLTGSSNLITANEIGRALESIWRGEVVSLSGRDYLMEKLAAVKPGLQYLIPAGAGDDAIVSHKNGFLVVNSGWVDNDAGIVQFERGGIIYAYAITILFQDVPEKYADIPLGQAISRAVWQYFSALYN